MGLCSPLKVWRLDSISYSLAHVIKKQKHITKSEYSIWPSHIFLDDKSLPVLSFASLPIHYAWRMIVDQVGWPSTKFVFFDFTVFATFFFPNQKKNPTQYNYCIYCRKWSNRGSNIRHIKYYQFRVYLVNQKKMGCAKFYAGRLYLLGWPARYILAEVLNIHILLPEKRPQYSNEPQYCREYSQDKKVK